MGFDDGNLDVGFRKEMFAGWNDEFFTKYTSKPKYRDRYSGLAALTTADPIWSALELERTYDDYGFIGGSLPLNAAASTQGLEQLRPIFEMANYCIALSFFTGVQRTPPSSANPHDTLRTASGRAPLSTRITSLRRPPSLSG